MVEWGEVEGDSVNASGPGGACAQAASRMEPDKTWSLSDL